MLADVVRYRDVGRIEGATTVADAVVVDNDLAFNVLTNSVHMQSVGLAETHDDAISRYCLQGRREFIPG